MKNNALTLEIPVTLLVKPETYRCDVELLDIDFSKDLKSQNVIQYSFVSDDIEQGFSKESFFKDTQLLFTRAAGYSIQLNLTDVNGKWSQKLILHQERFFLALTKYMRDWGCIFMPRKKSPDNIYYLTFDNIIEIARSGFYLAIMDYLLFALNDRNTKAIIKSLEQLRNDVCNHTAFKRELGIKARYWTLYYDYENRKTVWIPVEGKVSEYNTFRLYIAQPDNQILERIKYNDNDSEKEWLDSVRESILTSITDYLKKNYSPEFSHELNINKILLRIEYDSLLLCYVMGRYFYNQRYQPCKCGCGRFVPEGRKKWFSHECYERFRNSADTGRSSKRRLKAWIRKMQNDNRVSPQDKKKAYELIDEKSGEFNESQIRKMIKVQIFKERELNGKKTGKR